MAFSDLFITHIAVEKEGREGYPFNLPLIRRLEKLELTAPATIFAGENGTGKSTLLEAVAVAWGFNPEGGSRNFHFTTRSTHSPLHEALTLSKGVRRPRDGFFLRAESFYNVASEIERLDDDGLLTEAYGGKSLHVQSHGESFLALVKNRFRGQGLYILDEPEAALSPQRQLTLLRLLYELARDGSQLLMATHSPILLGMPGADIRVIAQDGALEKTRFEETEHVIVMKHFLNQREKMLRTLLEK